MADTPHPWGAYALLQQKLSSTTCIAAGSALEEALNVVLEPDFRPELVSVVDLERIASNAARQERHRASLRRQVHVEGEDLMLDRGAVVFEYPPSLDDAVHARRELQRIADSLREPDWNLLTGLAAGASYDELAQVQVTTASALRSRALRLRRILA